MGLRIGGNEASLQSYTTSRLADRQARWSTVFKAGRSFFYLAYVFQHYVITRRFFKNGVREKDGVSRVSYGVFFPEGERKRTCQLKKTINLLWCTMRPIFLLQRIFLSRSTLLGVELSQFLRWLQGSSLTPCRLEIFVLWVFRCMVLS